MYKILQSGIGNKITAVNSYSDLLKHHPSKGKESNRDYKDIDGKLEEVTITETGEVLIKKDYILYKNDSSQKVDVPCPVSGYIKTFKSYGTVKIYSDSKYTILIGKILHLDPNFLAQNNSYVEYGSPVGYQSGTGSLGTISYPIHVHMELEQKQYETYISDLLSGRFKNDVNKRVDKNTVKFIFPVVDVNGEYFQSSDKIYELLEKEKTGQYLLSSHNFWHGGVHFSDASVPHHVNQQPIRCMMDGEVIAYRLNNEYLTSDWSGNNLSYSSSFCLVKHEYQSPLNNDEGEHKNKQNKITLYSLYMHLAPYSAYNKKQSKAEEKDEKKKLKLKKTIRVRKGDSVTEDTPPVLGYLGAGSIIELMNDTTQFTVTEQ